MPKPVTLLEELADLRAELAMRQKVYPGIRMKHTDPRKVAALLSEHEHKIACTRATIARLEALLPTQTSLGL